MVVPAGADVAAYREGWEDVPRGVDGDGPRVAWTGPADALATLAPDPHGELWIEAHRNLYGENQASDLVQLIVDAIEKRDASVDWRRVDEVSAALTGVPVRL